MKEFWSGVWTSVVNFFTGYGLTIFKALAILVLGLLLITIVRRSVKKTAMQSRRVDNAASSFITSVVVLVAYIVLVIVLISTLGFSTAGIIAAFSSVMLAISLGLQNTLSSLTNGIVLIFTKPFSAGDFVDIGGTCGTVKEVKLFSVKIVTIDNITVVIPNNTVLSSVIINYSRMPLRRCDLVVSLSYDVDVQKAKEVVAGVIDADPRIKKDPAPFFRLTEYGAHSLNFTLRVWTENAVFWDVRFDLLERLLEALRANGMEIPYEQLDLHVVSSNKEDKAL